MKDIRTTTGMQTVPWRINVKEYEVIDEREKKYIKNYDIGMVQVEI